MEERPAGANASDADSDETDFDGLKTLCEHGQCALAAIWMFFHLAEEGQNAVPAEPCILGHQWSAETLNGPISVFHLPSYDNKICRVQHKQTLRVSHFFATDITKQRHKAGRSSKS